jgi:hypothetical protein
VKLTLRRVLVGAAASLLLAFAIVSASVEDRSPLRGLSAQGCWFPVDKVDDGQTVTRELPWAPDRDVYVVGWNALLAAQQDAAYEAELTLFDEPAKTRLFAMVQRRSPPAPSARWETATLPDGTGYRVAAGRRLVLRLRIKNTGSEVLRTEVSGAQIRYVPAD